MSDIHFIITGRTIDSVYHPPTETSVPNKDSIISEYLNQKIHPHLNISYETLCMLDSGDITDDRRAQVVTAIQEAASNHIIISHGTNTMVETANYIKEHLQGSTKTIILTGSMIPLKEFIMSDAGFNLGYAIAEAQNREHGVYICMHAKTFAAGTVTKNRTIARFEEA